MIFKAVKFLTPFLATWGIAVFATSAFAEFFSSRCWPLITKAEWGGSAKCYRVNGRFTGYQHIWRSTYKQKSKVLFFMFPEILKTPRLTTKTDFIYVFAYFWFFNLKTSKSPVAHLQLIKPLIKNVNIFCKKLSINDSPHGVITTE